VFAAQNKTRETQVWGSFKFVIYYMTT